MTNNIQFTATKPADHGCEDWPETVVIDIHHDEFEDKYFATATTFGMGHAFDCPEKAAKELARRHGYVFGDKVQAPTESENVELETPEEIIAAVDAGHDVRCMGGGYKVVHGAAGYMIVCEANNDTIALTGLPGTKYENVLNGDGFFYEGDGDSELKPETTFDDFAATAKWRANLGELFEAFEDDRCSGYTYMDDTYYIYMVDRDEGDPRGTFIVTIGSGEYAFDMLLEAEEFLFYEFVDQEINTLTTLLFRVAWTAPEYEDKAEYVTSTFFSNDVGYSDENIGKIIGLEVGETLTLGVFGSHIIRRVR